MAVPISPCLESQHVTSSLTDREAASVGVHRGKAEAYQRLCCLCLCFTMYFYFHMFCLTVAVLFSSINICQSSKKMDTILWNVVHVIIHPKNADTTPVPISHHSK